MSLIALLFALSNALAGAGPGDLSWREDPLWDDGRAEVSAYEVSWPRYGRTYRGRAMMVLVKEPWAADLDVKADEPRPDGFDVLKLNVIRQVRTGIYDYHQMASSFVRRQSGTLEKLATSSAEGCGISTAYLRDGELTLRDYFDGGGEREGAWPAGAVPEDGLAAMLRDYVAGDLPERILVVPSFLNGRLPEPTPESFRVVREEIGSLEVPAGTWDVVELRLHSEADEAAAPHAFRFEKSRPHRLVEARLRDGTVYRLAKSERLRYWDMQDPEGERWWPENLR